MANTKATARKKASSPDHCAASNEGEHAHPDHSYAIPRLRRIQGQLGGIEEMIQDGRYCVDVLIQFRAAMSALRNLEATVFETHLRHCVTTAMKMKDPAEADRKIKELTELLARRTQV